jgi:hypothetical protein
MILKEAHALKRSNKQIIRTHNLLKKRTQMHKLKSDGRNPKP